MRHTITMEYRYVLSALKEDSPTEKEFNSNVTELTRKFAQLKGKGGRLEAARKI